jgi:hypothetical protein
VLNSYADGINDPQVDAIYNPLANALHAPWNLAAIAAGKPVLTEKPFARNRSEPQLVHNTAQSVGVTAMEGFHYLFHPVTRRIVDLATGNALGRLEHVEVAMAMPAPEADDPRWSLELAGARCWIWAATACMRCGWSSRAASPAGAPIQWSPRHTHSPYGWSARGAKPPHETLSSRTTTTGAASARRLALGSNGSELGPPTPTG